MSDSFYYWYDKEQRKSKSKCIFRVVNHKNLGIRRLESQKLDRPPFYLIETIKEGNILLVRPYTKGKICTCIKNSLSKKQQHTFIWFAFNDTKCLKVELKHWNIGG